MINTNMNLLMTSDINMINFLNNNTVTCISKVNFPNNNNNISVPTVNSTNTNEDRLNDTSTIFKYGKLNPLSIPYIFNTMITIPEKYEELYEMCTYCLKNNIASNNMKNNINYYCAQLLLNDIPLDDIKKYKILKHLIRANNYIDSESLLTKLFFSWYLGDTSCNIAIFPITIKMNTLFILGHIYMKLLNTRNNTSNKCIFSFSEQFDLIYPLFILQDEKNIKLRSKLFYSWYFDTFDIDKDFVINIDLRTFINIANKYTELLNQTK